LLIEVVNTQTGQSYEDDFFHSISA
jgi:hypothetical protein